MFDQEHYNARNKKLEDISRNREFAELWKVKRGDTIDLNLKIECNSTVEQTYVIFLHVY